MVLEQNDVLKEVLVSLRNSDVLSTTIRDVVTFTQTGTLTGATTITISKPTVKNIRSLTIGSTAMIEHTDYDVDYDAYNITLSTTVTNSYSLVYDYGSDRVHDGYPRDDLNISSFPRIAVEYIDLVSEAGGFGNVNRNKHDLSVVVYSSNKKDVRETTHLIREWITNNQNSLHHLKLIKPVLVGPCLPASEFTKFKDKIFKQNTDFAGLLQYDVQ
jgi:hypothetical protein